MKAGNYSDSTNYYSLTLVIALEVSLSLTHTQHTLIGEKSNFKPGTSWSLPGRYLV